MTQTIIHKDPDQLRVPPRLVDYEVERQRFKWEAAARGLSGLPGGGGINIAHEAVDRHACSERATHTAIRWLAQGGARTDYTYVELRNLTNRFANVLRQLDCVPGARVFVLAGRIPELYLSVLGT
ncbi:MAG TPA: AMP-binding protein, partial [Blastocatellia bacterium]|nr:AMP-binding protein [Blastocatellia bacterium]